MGFFIKDMAGVPRIIIEFLKEQLDINEALDLSGYGQRPQTRTDHIKTIEKHLNFKSADKAYEKMLKTWPVSRGKRVRSLDLTN